MQDLTNLVQHITALGREHGISAEGVARLVEVATSDATLDPGATLDRQMMPPEPALESNSAMLHEERYKMLGLIGRGGMGEVHKVLDLQLGRVVAMKIMASQVHKATCRRFQREVAITATLQHPGVIPIYDHGQLQGGRLFYTMPEVLGTTLEARIQEVHQEPDEDWSVRRLLTVFVSVCDTMSYAHKKGVIHRDLKPDNIMLGEFGQVFVLDWGVSRSHLSTSIPSNHIENAPNLTRLGQVVGTPHYMSPEQARGDLEDLKPCSDVYALGSILYFMLTGKKPWEDKADVVEWLSQNPKAPEIPSHVPSELGAACRGALHADVGKRTSGAEVLGDCVRAWLNGVQQRERALEVVGETKEVENEIADLEEQARLMHQQASVQLGELNPWDGEDARMVAWDLQDKAVDFQQTAARLKTTWELRLHGALTHAPDLPESHAALVKHYCATHRAAEVARQDVVADELAMRIETHAHQLTPEHPERTAALRYLAGDGSVTLHTEPAGAEVFAWRYVIRGRRLALEDMGSLGHTPLRAVPLSMGSYLLHIEREGCEEVNYPVCLEREQQWHGCPPGTTIPQPIVLPPLGSVGADERYVPTGWFWVGGDQDVVAPIDRQRVWADGFIVQRSQVRNQQYLEFLNDLALSGRTDEALLYVPRIQVGERQGDAVPVYQLHEGVFAVRTTALDGVLNYNPQWPATCVDWPSCVAYARWWSMKTGQNWRLPMELEWEKAARGVDGRFFPWGDHFEHSWCATRRSWPSAGELSLVSGTFPVDESPYGVRDLAGGIRDWAGDVMNTEPCIHDDQVHVELAPVESEFINVRGGAFDFHSWRCAYRNGSARLTCSANIGFRLVRPYPDSSHELQSPAG